MDYRNADSAIVRPTSDGRRYELVLFEGDQVLYAWVLMDGFTTPHAPITGSLHGLEDINFRLSEANVARSEASEWAPVGGNTWRRAISPQRERNANDH